MKPIQSIPEDQRARYAATAMHGATYQELDESNAAMSSEIDESLQYAKRLATVIWEKHWKDDAPNWKPFNAVLGVLTQIDNMVSGMVRKSPNAAGEPQPPANQKR